MTTATISMFARDANGLIVSRRRKCKEGHLTEQKQINPEWLAIKSEGARELYSRDYQIESDGKSWLPGQCAKCRGRNK